MEAERSREDDLSAYPLGLMLSGCTAEEERTFFLHVILFCFGVGEGCASMAGGTVACDQVKSVIGNLNAAPRRRASLQRGPRREYKGS